MKIVPFLTLGVLVICSPAWGASPESKQIVAVENGLLPVNVFKGDKPWILQERMQHYGVPGVGIAVIQDFKVAWYKTYGLADRETGDPVGATTLFQAGSVSKPVAAFGALQLVEAGKLALDKDINLTLVSWTLPANEFTTDSKVTLRHLLSHTGGLTVHGFGGYAVGETVPSVVQVLDGSGPANSEAVRVDKTPGADFRYSGGGYTIVQLMMSDVTDKPFAPLMDELLISPLNMTHSTYSQPLPPEWLKHAAAGVLPDGSAVAGKRHTYPEMAAAGLWTTAEDLALFAIEMQKALKGESKLMSKDMAQTMATPVDSGYGLGWGISARGDTGYFSHGGWDEGFCSQLTAHLEKGYGVVVMINSNHPAFIDELVSAVAHTYGWDGYQTYEVLPVPKDWLSKYTGRYKYDSSLAISITSEADQLFINYSGSKRVKLMYTGDGLFLRRERPTPITFTDSENGPLVNFVLDGGGRQTHSRLADGEQLPGEILAEGSYENALAAFRAALVINPDEDSLSEGYLNSLGLDSLTDSPVYAIDILRINTDLYPNSANTWDSLAYAYRQSGNKEKAIENFRKALKRDPEFASALRGLAELGADR
ncbi:MAG: beta-lactamase family protein [Gammaproteobacteria bacterium]|nr:beta-lactamase family protein [Gammaproteobacteria bacterium]